MRSFFILGLFLPKLNEYVCEGWVEVADRVISGHPSLRGGVSNVSLENTLDYLSNRLPGEGGEGSSAPRANQWGGGPIYGGWEGLRLLAPRGPGGGEGGRERWHSDRASVGE
jgi:hypothetical protein